MSRPPWPVLGAVLLGGGRRLSAGLGSGQVELERTRVLEGEGGTTHLRYRVRR